MCGPTVPGGTVLLGGDQLDSASSPRNMIIVLSHKFTLNQLRSQHAVRPLSIQNKPPVLSVLSKLPVHEGSLASCTHSLKFFSKMLDLTELEFPAARSSSSFLNRCKILPQYFKMFRRDQGGQEASRRGRGRR